MKALVSQGVDINALDPGWYGLTALQAATKGGHTSVVEFLLSAGADPNTPGGNNGGRTARKQSHLSVPVKLLISSTVQVAAYFGHLSILDLLLAHGAQINEPAARYNGRTALQAACETGNVPIAAFLLIKGAEINAPPSFTGGITALQAASQAGSCELVSVLLERGALINAHPAQYKGETAIQAACSQGHIYVVDLLIQHGADVNAVPGRYGMTALQGAAKGGHLDVVKRFVMFNIFPVSVEKSRVQRC